MNTLTPFGRWPRVSLNPFVPIKLSFLWRHNTTSSLILLPLQASSSFSNTFSYHNPSTSSFHFNPCDIKDIYYLASSFPKTPLPLRQFNLRKLSLLLFPFNHTRSTHSNSTWIWTTIYAINIISRTNPKWFPTKCIA